MGDFIFIASLLALENRQRFHVVAANISHVCVHNNVGIFAIYRDHSAYKAKICIVKSVLL